MNISKYAILRLFLLLACVSTAAAQNTAEAVSTKRIRDLKLDSALMKREMPYRVIVPSDYDQAANRQTSYPAIYLLHGLTGHYNNWGDETALEEFTKSYDYVFVMPEGDNGWYSDGVKNETDKYESYIIRELIPEIEKKFRVKNSRDSRVIAGLSMGGYGALKFGMKYPDKFVLAGSFSGALNAAELQVKDFANWKTLVDSIEAAFGEADSDSRKANDLFGLVRTQTDESKRKLPFLYLDCGTEDFLIGVNQNFARLLFEKKIPHEYRQLPGKHDWKFWESQIREFLELSGRFVK
jgi:putative tributyrin esterase